MVGTANFRIFFNVTGFLYTFEFSINFPPFILYLFPVYDIINRTVTVQSMQYLSFYESWTFLFMKYRSADNLKHLLEEKIRSLNMQNPVCRQSGQLYVRITGIWTPCLPWTYPKSASLKKRNTVWLL